MKRASDQAYVEPRRMSLVQKRYSVVIRADETGHPTVVKASGIEERPQILFVAFWLKGFSLANVAGAASSDVLRHGFKQIGRGHQDFQIAPIHGHY